jgi:hypothetical protein
MNPAAIEWLNARFEYMMRHRTWMVKLADWHGPTALRQMIEFLPALATGEAMRVCPADYADPERWWL